MRVTYDREVNAAYIRLTEADLPGPHDTTVAETPSGVDASVALNWRDGVLVGLEVLDASHVLPDELLAQARPPGSHRKPREP